MEHNSENTTKVSIVVLVHNAPRFTLECLRTLRITAGVEYEVVVVDNGSGMLTKSVLIYAWSRGYVDRLAVLKDNLYFSGGNNLGCALASESSTHVLLLNSDVRIDSEEWLLTLLSTHRRGATSFGYAANPDRADGYCLLLDKDLYQQYRLDESFPWWWSITKLQSELLADGFFVTAVKHHDKYIHHYGGKSKVSKELVRQSREFDRAEVLRWFEGKSVHVINRI